MFHIALFEPEIAGNVGNIARTCLATGNTLHLIRPLGFRLTDDALKRSGLDYWNEVEVEIHNSFQAFTEHFAPAFLEKRIFSLTTKGTEDYTRPAFQAGDVFLFGPESRGLPESIRLQTRQLRIPMMPETRSLNLSVSVAVMVYEAWRQVRFSHTPSGRS